MGWTTDKRSARRDRAGRERRGHRPVIGEASVAFSGWKRLQVAGDRTQILLAHELRAVSDDICHAAERRRVAVPAGLERTEEAAFEAKEGLRLIPNFTVRRYADDARSDNPTYLAQRARILKGMRLAGVPEG